MALTKIEISFKHLKIGNDTRRKNLNYNIEDEIKLFKSIKKNFEEINFDNFQEKNTLDKNIIFILGMPRSGTTLIEQIVNLFAQRGTPFKPTEKE